MYQTILAARQQAPERLAEVYRDIETLVLTIDGLQPEKGHDTLYVVRELMSKRVWFAEPLLSSATPEVQRLIVVARQWAERLAKPVRMWMSDKQEAFVQAIATEFPAIPHHYCQNHFLRDVAKPVLEMDSQAKVKMRRRVRGLRALERRVLEDRVDGLREVRHVHGEEADVDAEGSRVRHCDAERGLVEIERDDFLRAEELRADREDPRAAPRVEHLLPRNVALSMGEIQDRRRNRRRRLVLLQRRVRARMRLDFLEENLEFSLLHAGPNCAPRISLGAVIERTGSRARRPRGRGPPTRPSA